MSINTVWKTRPTRYDLLKLKERLKLARKAHTLLEDKYRMLSLEKQKIRDTLTPFEKKGRKEIKKAYKLLLKSLMYSGIRKTELAAKSSKPNDEIGVNWEKIHGLSVPRIWSKVKTRSPLERGYGLSNTTPSIDDAASAFESVVSTMVTISELRNTTRTLEDEAKKMEIRVFALDRVLIPQLEKEIKRIEIKLEERERERRTIWRWISDNLKTQNDKIIN